MGDTGQNIQVPDETKEFNEEIPFTIAARVIYQLGEQLISNEYVALAELIKNSYDADCTNVRIIVNTDADTMYGKGQIIIQDNGNGMTRTLLHKSFLKISTDFKCVEKFSPGFKRRSLGEKGLGRLSIQRLGNYLELTTTPRLEILKLLGKVIPLEDFKFHENYNTSMLKVNWTDFFDSNKDFSDMKTKCQYLQVDKPAYGTKIVINGIRNLNFWKLDTRMKTLIKSEIFGMVNPFIQESKEKFEIDLYIDGERFTNDKIDQNILKIMSDIIVSFSFKGWILEIKILYKKKYLERLSDNSIQNMKYRGFDRFKKLIDFKDFVQVHTLDLSKEQYKIMYPYLEHIVFQNIHKIKEMKNKKFIFKDNRNKVKLDCFKTNKLYLNRKPDLVKNLSRRMLAYPGEFYGYFYVTDQSGENFKISQFDLGRMGHVFNTQKELKSIWSAAEGVYLFRNNFRILPYGPENDWLAFTSRSQRIKFNAYKEHTVSGYVQLDSLSSENLKEQTNREGLIQDEYGSNFLTIMKDIIAYIAFKSDINIRDGFNVLDIKDEDTEIRTKNNALIFYRTIVDKKKKEDIVDEIKQVSDKLVSKETDNNSILAATTQIKAKVQQLTTVFREEQKQQKQRDFEYEKKMDYFRSLVGLAGQSIVVEALTHELHRIEENIKTYAEDTIDKIEGCEDDHHIADEAESLIDYQEKILEEIDYLQRQLEHLEPTYRNNSLLIESVNLKSFIEHLYSVDMPMGKKAAKENIKVNISGNDLFVKANKGMLITIFDNIFLNSIYWVNFSERHSNVKEKEINFNINNRTNSVTIWDSGIGIHPEIEEELFLPEKSMKKGGRGLGLFIARELINYLNGEIILDKREKNVFGQLHKFVLTFEPNKS